MIKNKKKKKDFDIKQIDFNLNKILCKNVL